MEGWQTTDTVDGYSIHVQVVLYCSSQAEVWRMLRGLLAATRSAKGQGPLRWLEIALGDCSPAPVLTPEDVKVIREHASQGGVDSITYEFFQANLGSALGHNVLASNAVTDLLLILNPDTYPSPTLLTELLAVLREPRVGIVEARQVPIEHPKAYDLVTGDTSWASTCCVLVRRAIFEEVGGFDHETFRLYCDDVDFSWRVRLGGLRVVHAPQAVVFHDKRLGDNGKMVTSPVEVYEGTLARLLLARKYGRQDIVEETIRWVENHGTESQVDALAEYRRRCQEGRVPEVVGEPERVAQFVDGEYAVHRF